MRTRGIYTSVNDIRKRVYAEVSKWKRTSTRPHAVQSDYADLLENLQK